MINAIKTQDWLCFVEPVLLPVLRLDYRVYNRYVLWRRSHYNKKLHKLTVELLPIIESFGCETSEIRIALNKGASETAYRKCKEIVECLKKST